MLRQTLAVLLVVGFSNLTFARVITDFEGNPPNDNFVDLPGFDSVRWVNNPAREIHSGITEATACSAMSTMTTTT